jgi:hypothetical protein
VEPGLKRFWLEFDITPGRPDPDLPARIDDPTPGWAPVVRDGVGVTASDVDECLDIVRAKIFGRTAMPRIKKVVEDIDISTLDEGHVLPHMEPPIWRGIWFPQGFADSPMT